MVAKSEEARRDRRPEREVQPAERPARDDDRHQGEHIGTETGRNAEDGFQRGDRARTSCRRFRHAADGHASYYRAGQQHREDEVGRGGSELDERTATNRTHRQAADRRDAVDEAGAPRGVRRVQVDERGSECRKCRTGCDALEDASDDKHRHATCDEEQDERSAFQRDRRGQNGTATNVIGKTAENEQRADEGENVDRENDG